MEQNQEDIPATNRVTVLAKVTDTPAGQRIELPAGFRIGSPSIYIRRSGDVILLIPADNPWASLLDSLDRFSDDYMTERCQPGPQVREQL